MNNQDPLRKATDYIAEIHGFGTEGTEALYHAVDEYIDEWFAEHLEQYEGTEDL